MTRLKRDNCTLHKDGTYVYHVRPTGSDVYTATVRRFMSNGYYQRWGVRPYNSPNDPWVLRSTLEEVVDIALALPAHRQAQEKT
jgi:hypothetical protein